MAFGKTHKGRTRVKLLSLLVMTMDKKMIGDMQKCVWQIRSVSEGIYDRAWGPLDAYKPLNGLMSGWR